MQNHSQDLRRLACSNVPGATVRSDNGILVLGTVNASSKQPIVAESNHSIQETSAPGGAIASAGKPIWQAAGRALRHRNFQLFFGGQLISLVGTWMQTVAQAWLVYRLTGSGLLLGSVGFASQIPVFLFAPIGGITADRSNRQRVVIATQTASMLLAFVLARSR